MKGRQMKILNSIGTGLQTKEPQLTRRLFNGGWEAIGRIRRKCDERTTKQLLENIDYFAKKLPEVAQFKEELKTMDPKHLGLVSDICELASNYEMINTAINIRKPASNGKSLFQVLLEKLPKASKENPASIELTQEIINNTDATAAKYSLAALHSLFECKEAAGHMKATVPFISDIADATLQGGYTMDFSKEKNFINGISNFVSPKVSLEKLKLLSEVCKIADSSNAICEIQAFPFLLNQTPISRILENLNVFKSLDKNMQGKSINLTEFLEKNINLV